jgi:hypothetical protein
MSPISGRRPAVPARNSTEVEKVNTDTFSTCKVKAAEEAYEEITEEDGPDLLEGKEVEILRLETKVANLMASTRRLSADVAGLKAEITPKKPLQVLLHIYDVTQEDSVQKINRWLAHPSNPLKFGGIFHAGVEIDGLEWSYGASDRSSSVPGISCCEPRGHPHHRYRETVALNPSKLSPEDVGELLTQMIEEYPGHDYDLLRRNCCHFADEFCRRIGAGGIPGWVHRLARFGAGVDTLMYKVMRHRLLIDEDEGDEDLCEEEGVDDLYWCDSDGDLKVHRASPDNGPLKAFALMA